MTPRMLRNAGLTSITALSLALVACGGSSSSAPPVPVNLPPVFNSVSGPTTVVSLHTATYSIMATDPEGKAVAFTTSDAGATITGNLLSYKPTAAGIKTVTITATDADGKIATYPLAINVTANNAPTIALSDLTLAPGANLTLDLGAALDADNDAVTYTLTGKPSFVTQNGSKIVLAPQAADAGKSFKFTISATDGFVAAPVTKDVTITISAITNLPPTNLGFVGSASGIVGHAQYFQLTGIDPEGGAVTFTTTTAGASITGNLLTFVPATAGAQTITVTAADAASNTKDFSTTVNVAANQAPVVTASPSIGVAAGGNLTVILGDSKDADNDSVAYTVAMKDGSALPTWIKTSANTLVLTPATTDQKAVKVVTVTATDGFGGTTTKDLTVTVGALSDGSVTAYPVSTTTVQQGVPFTFQFTASSSLAGETLAGATWALNDGTGKTSTAKTATVGAMSIDAATGVLTWNVNKAENLGRYTFGVLCTFPSGVVAYQTFYLTVGVDNAPVFSAAAENAATKITTTVGTWASYSKEAAVVLAGDSTGSLAIVSKYNLVNVPSDVDVKSGDSLTFAIDEVVADQTGDDITTVLPTGTIALTPWTYNKATDVWSGASLTLNMPKVGEVMLDNGGAPVALATGNLLVTISATDGAGKKVTNVVTIPLRTNDQPTVDNYTAKAWTQTSGDSTATWLDVQSTEDLLSTWTLGVAAPGAAAATKVADTTDKIAKIVLNDTDYNNGFQLYTSGNIAIENATQTQVEAATSFLVKRKPTTAQSRTTFDFTVNAWDHYGYAAQPVKVEGTVNGTLRGTSARTIALAAGNKTVAADYSNAGSANYGVTINPFFTSTGSPYRAKFGTEIPDNWAYWGDATGNFNVNSVPAGYYLASSAKVEVLPANVFAFMNATNPNLSSTFAGRVAFSGLPVLQSTSETAFGLTAGKLALTAMGATTYAGTMNTIGAQALVNNEATSALQIVNANLGQNAFFQTKALTGTSAYPGVAAAGKTTAVTIDNLGATYNPITLDFNGVFGYEFNNTNSKDTVKLAAMTGTSNTATYGSTPSTTNLTVYTATRYGVPTAEVTTTGVAATQMSNFTAVTADQTHSGAIKRSAFGSTTLLKQVGASATAAFVNDSFEIVSATYGADLGLVNGGWAPTVLRVANTNGVTIGAGVDYTISGLNYGNPFGGTLVQKYTYNYTSANAAITGGVVALSAGTFSAPTATVTSGVAPVTGLMVSTNAGNATTMNTLAKASTLIAGYQTTTPATTLPAGGYVTSLAYNNFTNDTASTDHITLTWTNPSSTNFSGVVVSFYDLGAADPVATPVAMPAAPQSVVYTKNTMLPVPATLVTAGHWYVVKVRSVAMPGVDFNVNPFQTALPYSWSEVASVPVKF